MSARETMPADVSPWQDADLRPILGHAETHLWLVSVTEFATKRGRLAASLSEKERERAARFRFDRDRNRFIVRRAALRDVLSRYMEVTAKEIRFSVMARGKPRLADGLGDHEVRFNDSSSADWALIGVARKREIGVDLERIDPARADPKIAEHFFAPGEIDVLRDLSGRAWLEGFFNCWTRKEAFVKSLGEGLYFPLDAFEVTLAPGEPARLLSMRGTERNVSRWAMKAIQGPPGYVAALASEGEIGAVRCWRWSPQ